MTASSIIKKLNSRDTRLFPKVNTLTKITFIALIAISATFFVKNIFATTNIIKQTQDAQLKSNNAESWQLNSWNTTAVNALTTLTGPIEFNDDGTIKTTGYIPSGMIGVANNMVASLYSPAASGVQYIAQIKDNFLGKQTYAQGISFNSNGQSLQPLLPIWKAFRNIVYALFSVVFIVIGIMIMLRVKISPQAVITLQNSIPKLITSLVLVTFSYAIAGLIIDISYFIQGLAIALIFQAKGVPLTNNLFSGWSGGIPIINVASLIKIFDFDALSNANFTKLNLIAQGSIPIGSMFTIASVVGQVVLGTIVGGILGIVGNGGNLVGQWVGGILGGSIIGAIGGVIMIVIVLILVIIWLLKLWFGLLKTYVTIIIQIVTAPFTIGMGAFPNSKVGFSSWFIDLFSKVAVFPVTLIATIFIGYLAEIVGKCNLWVPNLLNMDLHMNGACSGNFLGAAVGLAGLAMLSKLPDLVPEAIFMLKPSPFGKAIGENLEKNVFTGALNTGKKSIEEGINDYGSRRVSGKITKIRDDIKNKKDKKINDKTGESMSDGSGI